MTGRRNDRPVVRAALLVAILWSTVATDSWEPTVVALVIIGSWASVKALGRDILQAHEDRVSRTVRHGS
jgi:hypothetical protein